MEAKGRGRHFEVIRMIITFIYSTLVIWNFIIRGFLNWHLLGVVEAGARLQSVCLLFSKLVTSVC